MAALTAPSPAPPSPGRRDDGRLRRLATPAGLGAAALAGVVALAVRDPHAPGSWGFCPSRLVLGIDCPGCGALRGVHDLTQGDVAAALSSNVVIVSLLPVAAVVWLVWLGSRWRGRSLGTSRQQLVAGVAVAALLLAFGVVRNLPGMEWLLS